MIVAKTFGKNTLSLMQHLKDVHQQRQWKLTGLRNFPCRNDLRRMLGHIGQADQGIIGFSAKTRHLPSISDCRGALSSL